VSGATKGAPGVDGMTVDEQDDHLKAHWPEIRTPTSRMRATGSGPDATGYPRPAFHPSPVESAPLSNALPPCRWNG